jgi:outer membrane protein OmpA-like peptidoglycan-associated protein/ABC-type nitrate/sulfonate/bicarbonate transport system substrate-binding protein
MKLTRVSKILIFAAIAVAVAVFVWKKTTGKPEGDGKTAVSALGTDLGLLGRPLRVGVVTWPGYCGGLVANGGFKPNKETIYWKNHKLLVEFLLMEDVDIRAKAFAKGGADGVDVVWSTVDFWANELPGFLKGGVKARAVMQVDWSRGGDAIVADKSITRIEDLKGKRISLALFTPSHWLLEYSLENSSLDEVDQTQIVKGLVGKNASPDARVDFVTNKVDAAVVWEPDVTEALQKRPGAHILVSSKTAANLIADIMVAREDFIAQHADVVKAFVEGWLEGTVEANRNPSLAVKALMDNEPLYKDLGEKATQEQLSTVKWADLTDNTKMFGLDGKEPLFDRIYKQASEAWVKRGYITGGVTPDQAKEVRFLKEIHASAPVQAVAEEFKFPETVPAEKAKEQAIMTKPVNIFFPTGVSDLDDNAKQILDQVALTAQTYSNAYIRLEGNTDNVGDPKANLILSQKRAESVRDYLIHTYNFTASRFVAKGNGDTNPVVSNDTPEGKLRNNTAEGRAKNRRTDVKVIPR